MVTKRVVKSRPHGPGTGRFFMSRMLALLLILSGSLLNAADPPAPDTTFGDSLLQQFFRNRTTQLADECLSEVATLNDWKARKDGYRQQLFNMLGLDPLPERTPLQPVITGAIDHPDFVVEKLHFQSLPGLYVTGNLYRPREISQPLPAILYVCGHAVVKSGKISFGNKAGYQHHGAWFARNGYVCLTIDTIQLGEIEGLHHGTHRQGMWWWHSRGYTPAGVEAWNCIRALDYLQSRPEVDGERIGVTGRSGGGAYSWWIAALDERIKVAVPVAGITSMQNHIVDNCIKGHCDCMFMVNSYRWDFPLLASLIAPRPLLLSNTDKDPIFPVDGVYDVYRKTRRIYDLHKAGGNFGLHITEGGHKDTPELRAHAFVWFDRFLKQEKDQTLLDLRASKLFPPEELKVFETLPDDERVTTVHEWFVPLPETPAVPKDETEWAALKDRWLTALRTQVLDECPSLPAPCEPAAEFRSEGVTLNRYRLFTDGVYPLDLYTARGPKAGQSVRLEILDQPGYERFAATLSAAASDLVRGATPTDEGRAAWQELREELRESDQVRAWFVPRGIGPTEWSRTPQTRVHILRSFALLGLTADEVQTYDTVQALRAIRGLPGRSPALTDVPLTLVGEGAAAGWALYAAVLNSDVQQLDLTGLPATHDDGPIYLNVRRYLDIPEALALAAEQCPVRLDVPAEAVSSAFFADQTADALGWGPERIVVYSEAR